MAANMPQMGPNGQQMLIPRQLQPVVYQSLLSTNQSVGWQATVPIQDRMGKAINLITNCILAAPGQEWQHAVRWGLEIEKKAYQGSPDRQTYEQHLALQLNEMIKKRQANAPDLQAQLSSDAARQSQLQVQQQQMLMNMNQMAKSMGQPMGQGLQHLQHQMQPSPIPQQAQQQQMALGMTNQAMLQNRLNQQQQQQFSMTQQQQQRPPNTVPTDMNQLSLTERRALQDVAQKLLNSTPEPQRAQQRAELMQKMNPQLLQEMQNSGRDPLLYLYQQKAFTNMQRTAQLRIMQQRGQGLPQNMDPAQAQALLLQQRQMSQGMMNLGQQPGMGDNQVFASMESIRNDQKAGMLAQQAGQQVVPANSGPGRNPTPQAMNGLSLQNMPNGMHGAGQQPRPQMTQQQLQQQLAAQQARLQQQGGGRPMQQPGGMQGPVTTSQSPGMTTLTAPMQQPPVPMTPISGPQMNNQGMGQPLGDPRFNQGNRQAMQANLLNHPMVKAMMNNLSPEQRQSVSNMPPEKIRELVTKWTDQQRAAMNAGAQVSKPPQMGGMPTMAGMPGQGAAGQMNPMNQFGLGNAAQPPQPANGGAPPGMQNLTDGRFNAAVNTPGARNIMDSMDIPPPVLAQLNQMPLNMPAETKKWGQLKNWMAQTPNPITPALRNQLNNFQLQQFRALLDRRTMQNNGAQPGQPGRPMIPPGGQPPNALAQQPPNQAIGTPPGVPVPPQVRNVTQAEIDNYRKNNPNTVNLTNEMIGSMLLKLKADAWTKKYYETQGMNRPGAMAPTKPQGPTPQAPQMHPGPQAGPAQVNPPKAPVQKPQPPAPDANAAKNARQPQPAPRPVQTNPSPATAQKNLKRSNPDDSNDVQQVQTNGAAQPNQRPMSQADQRPMPQPTPEQLARMTPEQRARFEQMAARNRQIALSPEDVSRLKTISAEEQKSLANEQMQDIPMTMEERAETISKIQETVKNMSKIGRGLGRWYSITHDDSRARMFFRTRMRLIRQFADGDKMTQLRDSFSIRSSELDHARNMMESMAKDLAAHFDIPKKHEANGGQTGQQPQQQPTPRAQPAPLNAANLERQTQALNKMQHQKTGSKSGAPPPAPTTTQPPLQFGVQQPTGQPTYLNQPTVTQDSLTLPPARKKTKTGSQSQPTPSASGPGTSPQTVKAQSPEAIKRQAPEPKLPKFVCPEPDCEMHSTGFATDEARKAHYQEEHVKPLEDPYKFVSENLATTLGLDPQGLPKAPVKAADNLQLAATPMASSMSKQGQTPTSKPDLASTPMSRDASMRRQGSMSGGKLPDNMSTPGRSGLIKSEDTPKPGDAKLAVKPEPDLLSIPLEDPWAGSTIDPQSLLASFAPLEPMAGGLLSDLSMYRSMTPNDTPESSKDSGASEPNSDVSETAHIDIDINWQPIDADLLLDMNNVNMEGFDYSMDADAMGGDNFQFPSWDESEFSKSFQLDGSLFSMDTTS